MKEYIIYIFIFNVKDETDIREKIMDYLFITDVKELISFWFRIGFEL